MATQFTVNLPPNGPQPNYIMDGGTPVLNAETFNKQNSKIYLLDMNIDYQVDRNPFAVANIVAINKMIDNVVMTIVGSRWFEPTFGSLFPTVPFRNMNGAEAVKIMDDIEDALDTWLPMIVIDRRKSNVYFFQVDTMFYVKLFYAIKGFPEIYNTELAYASPAGTNAASSLV